ncbi:unnamed protein product [Rhizoctonia solani]|uniref:Uncharacterized protein n=1 Tax=Rhizoctonia solani TaxID=456999 RepID=A0A8H3CAE7_9AGAM|nr:unnamed protein product [Rhizoctonia solani]
MSAHHHHHHQQHQQHQQRQPRPIFEHLNERHNRLAAWFLGPKAENAPFLRHFFEYIAKQTEEARNKFQPADPKFIDTEIQTSSSFQQEIKDLDGALKELTNALADHSIPFWSPRYNAHMTYDTSMPALLGYLATTLFNPNNVATEASPLTSVIEREVGLQLCEMLGYDVRNTESSRTWGHITCGGSIANLESIWAARNLKFYPLSLACAIEPGAPLASIRDEFEVEVCTGEKKLFSKLDTWELLNLKPDTVFELPERLENEFGISSTFLSATMNKYLIQSIGKDVLEKKFEITKPTRYFVGGTKHYSWPKGAALTGIGSDNIKDIPVDINARLDPAKLDELLQECLNEKRAVYAVVAIMGSTEHGAVDPLEDVVKLREKYQKQGLSFAIHADAAWGGYFTSLLREEGLTAPVDSDPGNKYVPELALSSHTRAQLDHLKYADSITIDPHKSGYIPYPAGGLCYRDGRMRFLVTWLNPDVYKDSDGDEGMGVYGVEGSKPGAAPVAAWVSHRMYTHWVTMDMDDRHLVVVPLNPIPADREGKSEAEIQKQREYIRDNIVNRPNLELVRDDEAMKLVRELGSDLSINAFACNFRLANGEINKDVVESNYLNTRIYERLSVTKIEDNIFDKPLFIMSTSMEQKVYGDCCNHLKKRLGLVGEQDLELLVNCVMSPFPTVANFTQDVADAFKKIAHEEIQKCLFRNTITADDFRFIVQGTDKPYLTLLPMFNMANYRHQLILSCELPKDVLETYTAERAKDPSAVFYIGTTKDVKLESILAGSFEAMLEKGLPAKNQPPPQRYASDFQVTNIKVLKNSPIDSKYLDPSFPDYMYFYLYGTKDQKHIEHMLVSSSNAQLTSDQVDLQLSSGSALSDADLAKGLIVRLDNIHENIVLPVLPPNTPAFFTPGKELKVSIFQDPHAADAHGPGLTDPLSEATPIASGTLKLGKMVYADSVLVNGNPALDGTLEVDEGVSGTTLEERLTATRRNFVAEDHQHVDSYYKRRDKQAAWRHYVEKNLSSIGHDTAGVRPQKSRH